MTDEQIIRAVAEKVMGWIKGRDFLWETYGPDGQFGDVWILSPDPPLAKERWLPLTDANHTMMVVVEKMREKGWSCQIWTNPGLINVPVRWGCRFWTYAQESTKIHEKLGHAVCLAALQAEGGK